MEPMDLEVVYEHGTLKLPHELPLQEGQKIKITIHAAGGVGQRLHGLIQWKGSQEDLDYLLGPDNHPWNREESRSTTPTSTVWLD
jgi:predicted DNA-binding antitoxin AbrB/MazE fold protein